MIIAVKLTDAQSKDIASGTMTINQAKHMFDDWTMNAMIIDPQLPEVEGDIRERTVGELIDAVKQGRWQDG